MSTISEHLATLQFMQAMRWSRNQELRRHGQFTQEAALFCEVHLEELVAERPPAEMQAARLDVERRIREQLPTLADTLIEAWHADEAPAIQPPV